MQKTVIALLGIALLVLSGCGGTWTTNYDRLDASVTRGWNVQSVSVTVPDTLTVTEQDSFAPNADIVWHGDPLGDRKAQIAKVMQAGISKGASGLRGPRSVNIGVTVRQFHSVTPRAQTRAPGAVHNISYVIQVFDRAGNPLTQPQVIAADLEAFVGSDAIQAAQRGQTQKVRITNHLAAVTAGWLGIGPDVRGTFSGPGR
ncbi:DUF6778 family protein [Parasulfitobacter algicola]|uniref:Lipoprotein n=1 Tax=Parasulfitobacter algicola TaxID=2614809 RepID=A0ABX2IU84_9RHOB|nr:DUF6778 family protein [Sulfitobacter algicola]NSX56115.1 hypothetical protein [Sulfitobacter algicola]